MKKITLSLYLILVLALSGCTDKDKENAVSQQQTKAINEMEEQVTLSPTAVPHITTPTVTPEITKQVNVEDNELLNNLTKLCIGPRKFGTDGEERALNFLIDKMTEYGYQTQIQQFSVYHLGDDWFSPASKQLYFEQNRVESKKFGTGKNLIAALANTGAKKTLYITAHYDTTEDTNGIRDNGSGVVTVMEIARQLQGISLPINIEFVFFSAEEAGLQGSAYFVSQLSGEEKDNALGCINIDVVGQNWDSSILLKTCSSQINVLSILMDKYHDFKHKWSEASDHKSFFMGEIPAIYLADSKALLKDNTDNSLDELDLDKLKELTKTICDFILEFDLMQYNEILQNGYIKEYKDLPKTEAVLGYSLVQINKVLKENGSGSDIQYILENKDENQVTITEQDSRFLDDGLIKDMQTFTAYNNDVKYKVSEKGNKIIVQYSNDLISYNYNVLEGNISEEDALELLNNQDKFIGNIILLELD